MWYFPSVKHQHFLTVCVPIRFGRAHRCILTWIVVASPLCKMCVNLNICSCQSSISSLQFLFVLNAIFYINSLPNRIESGHIWQNSSVHFAKNFCSDPPDNCYHFLYISKFISITTLGATSHEYWCYCRILLIGSFMNILNTSSVALQQIL